MSNITLITVFLFAFGLSADAFAVSVCEGMRPKGANTGHALKVAAYFGIFQALMPTFGYFIADVLEKIPFLDKALDWFSFGLLFLIAVKMFWDAWHDAPEEEEKEFAAHGELILLAIATSIDALGAGMTFGTTQYVKPFAFITHAFVSTAARNTWSSLLSFVIIGLTTFTLSFIGVKIGKKAGEKLGRGAQFFGAAILFLLAVKALLEIFGIKLGF